MVKVKFCTLVIILFSCSSGHNNQYGVYVPNKPKYTLKDKEVDKIPKELDTINVYKCIGYYYDNNLIKFDFQIKNWNIYYKFCSKGRVFGFGTDKLTEKNLDPKFATQDYYIYNKKINIIIKESFVDVQGNTYIKIKYILSKSGDTLFGLEKNIKESVYVKEIIPREWKRYKPDW